MDGKLHVRDASFQERRHQGQISKQNDINQPKNQDQYKLYQIRESFQEQY